MPEFTFATNSCTTADRQPTIRPRRIVGNAIDEPAIIINTIELINLGLSESFYVQRSDGSIDNGWKIGFSSDSDNSYAIAEWSDDHQEHYFTMVKPNNNGQFYHKPCRISRLCELNPRLGSCINIEQKIMDLSENVCV